MDLVSHHYVLIKYGVIKEIYGDLWRFIAPTIRQPTIDERNGFASDVEAMCFVCHSFFLFLQLLMEMIYLIMRMEFRFLFQHFQCAPFPKFILPHINYVPNI